MLSSGGYREGETPGPIPNPEAKPLFADNTAGSTCGNVGRRLDFFTTPSFTQFYQNNHFLLTSNLITYIN